jgi:polygalacturonase
MIHSLQSQEVSGFQYFFQTAWLFGLDNLVSDITVRDCVFSGGGWDKGGSETAALRIKSAQRAGGLVRNVSYANITASRIGLPLHIDQFYCADDKSICDKAYDTTIVFENITVDGLSGTQVDGFAGIVNCSFGETRCRGLVLKNINITAADSNLSNTFSCLRAQGNTLSVFPPGCDLV